MPPAQIRACVIDASSACNESNTGLAGNADPILGTQWTRPTAPRPSQPAAASTVASGAQQQLAQVGIDMQLRPLPPSDASPTFNRGDADAIVTTFTGRADPSILLTTLYGAESPQNPSRGNCSS